MDPALNGIPAEQVVAVSCTGPVGEHRPGGRGGGAGRALRDVAGHARSAVLTRRDRRPADGLFAAARWRPGFATPAACRHRSAVTRSATCFTWSVTSPTVAAAARWYLEPVDYLSMRFTGRAAASHASMSAVWLTDNRRLDRLEYDPALVRRTGLDARKLPPLVETGSLIGAVRPEVAADLGISPSGAGGHRDPGPALGRAGLRRDRRGRATHDHQHHLLDLAAVPAQEDRSDALDRDRAGAGFVGATSSRTTTRRPGSACAGCGRASPSTSRRATSA